MTEPSATGAGPARPRPTDLRSARPGRPAGSGTTSAPSGAENGADGDAGAGVRLWPGDHGTLPAPARLALARLVRGPYLAAESDQDTWRALLTNEDVVRERLADQYLDLVVDADAQVAFVRDVPAQDAPQVVRELTLTFLDTALLLHLRALLLDSADARVAISRDEAADHLGMYRRRGGGSPMDFTRQLDATWARLIESGMLEPLSGDRCVVSPVLRTVFGADQVAALSAEYARLAKESA
ncbi:protein of unknown function (DUF4194) [Promicromonospora umidemergens]|uniref:DUF4194 domain-containing protein n=1 Tax=Promicromonospora umidemergens TaxID=629679 RepID=A0ABP8XFP3_9MICO|nr:DUF4194 domain-containing protein [Promicromonospora umidemergens]MCP2283053.1 protein of unknown function (DUF4194) [Promicromonospora umidemergens]